MTWEGFPGHTPQGSTLTIQDDVLPMAKILSRYARGIDIPKGGGFYGDVEDDEHESSDYNRVMSSDLVDQQEIAEDRAALIEYIHQETKKQKEKKPDEIVQNVS